MLPEKCTTILWAIIGGHIDTYLFVERSSESMSYMVVWQPEAPSESFDSHFCFQKETPQITFQQRKTLSFSFT